ncbi:hypothetical protein [Lacunimicrobium album]
MLVTIRRQGNNLDIPPEAVLRYGDLSARCIQSTHGTNCSRRRIPLLRQTNEFAPLSAGLLQCFAALVDSQGGQANIVEWPSVAPLPEAVFGDHPFYASMDQLLRSNSRGQILISSPELQKWVIWGIAKMYPSARIIILIRNDKDARELATFLSHEGINARYATARQPLRVLDGAEENYHPPAILCATPGGACENADFETCDLVILLNAYDCVLSHFQDRLRNIDCRFRLFGLVNQAFNVAPRDADFVTALFGTEAIRVGRNGSIGRDTCCIFLPFSACPNNVAPTERSFAFQVYWRHDERNHRIRRLATSLRTADQSRQLPQSVERWLQQHSIVQPSVAILVERPLHAQQLSELLPDWPIVATDQAIHRLNRPFQQRVARMRSAFGLGDHGIVLAQCAESVSAAHVDILINACGRSTVVIPDSWLYSPRSPNRPLLVIDFTDNHNQYAKRWSRIRRRSYRAKHFHAPNRSESEQRLENFIKAQEGWEVR